MKKILSPISKEIWFMLDYPEDWMFNPNDTDQYVIIHKQTQIGLWIANAVFGLDGYKSNIYKPNYGGLDFTTKKPEIGVFERWVLWYKVKRVIKFLNNSITDPILEELREFNESKRG